MSTGTSLGCRARALGGSSILDFGRSSLIGAVTAGETFGGSIASAAFRIGAGRGSTGVGVFALTFRVKVGFVRPTFRRIAATGVDLEAGSSAFFAIFAAADCFLAAAVGNGADFNFATSFAILETGFDFSVGLGGVFLDLPIFIRGPRDLRPATRPKLFARPIPVQPKLRPALYETSPTRSKNCAI